MKSLTIQSFLKQASLLDLLRNGEGSFLMNKEIFHKSMQTGKFEGPYLLENTLDYNELIHQWSYGMIYTIDTEHKESSIRFKLRLREASGSDLSINKKELKIGISYYLLNGDKIRGPYFLNRNTNVNRLAIDLSTKSVFVISKKQSFELVKLEKIAS